MPAPPRMPEAPKPEYSPPPGMESMFQTEAQRYSRILDAVSAGEGDIDETLAKIATSVHIADRLKLDPELVYREYDSYAKAYWGRVDPPKKNWEAIQNEFRIARLQAKMGDIAWDWVHASPERRAALWPQLEALQAQMPSEDDIKRSLPISMLQEAAKIVPDIFASMSAGMATGLAAAGTAAALGQAPPQIFAPEELLTVPLSYIAAAGTAGAAVYSARREAGGAILEMLRAGVDPEVARAFAYPVYVLNGLVETLQLRTLLKGIPGAHEVAEKAIRALTRNAAVAPGLRRKALNAALRIGIPYVGETISETGQELVQESWSLLNEELAKQVSNAAAGTDLDPASVAEITAKLGDTVRSSIKGFSLVGAPGAAIRGMTVAASGARADKASADFAMRIDRIAKVTDATKTPQERIQAIDQRVAELEAEQKQIAPDAILESATEWTPEVDKQVRLFRDNEHELAVLRQLRREEEANDPNAPWRRLSREQPVVEQPLVLGARTGALKEMLGEIEEIVTPQSQFRQTIRDLSPDMPEQQVDALGLIVSALAYTEGVPFEDYLSQRFAPEFARRAEPGELPEGKRGAFVLSQKLILITERSDFSTWAHEIGHGVFTSMSPELLAPVAEWAGAVKEDGSVVWDEQAHENLVAGWVRYLQEGFAPTPELKTIFQRMTEWLLKAVEVISQRPEWKINDDIRQWMSSLLAKPESGIAQAAAPTAAPATEVEAQAPRASAETDELELYQSDPEALFEEAVDVFGVTDDIRAGGYILPDGRMLDFSDENKQRLSTAKPRRWSGLVGPRYAGELGNIHLRNVPHSQIMGDMHAFIAAGAIRMDGTEGYIMLGREPTSAQQRVIADIAAANNGCVAVEIQSSADPYDPANWKSNGFLSEADPAKLVGAIRRYFRTGQLPVGQVLYQSDSPEAAEIQQAIEKYSNRIRQVQAGPQPADYAREIAEPLERLIPVLKNATDKGMMFVDPKDHKWQMIIHRSTKPEDGVGAWRTTVLYGGMPTGHRVGKLVDLIEEQVADGMVVSEQRGAPILPEEARGRTVLRPDMLYQTDTPEFRQWFGDSKVVDEQGKPLTVYHGTSTFGFESFDKDRRGGLGGALGFWFATTQVAAQQFARQRFAGVAPGVYQVYLSIKNPKEYHGYSELVDDVIARRRDRTMEEAARGLRRSLIRAGYDGIVVRGSDTDQGGLRDDWVAFEPTQIKSAIANRGTYSPLSPNMLYQPEPGPTWYLRSQRIIEQKMAGPMPGRQILNMLKNAGIKEDELKWTGLATYLDTDERRSPQDITAELSLNRLTLKENVSGVPTPAQQQRYSESHRHREAAIAEFHYYKDELVQVLKEKGYDEDYARNLIVMYVTHRGTPEQTQIVESADPELAHQVYIADHRMREAIEEFERVAEMRPPSGRYQHWTLPGGTQYKELLLTLEERPGEYGPWKSLKDRVQVLSDEIASTADPDDRDRLDAEREELENRMIELVQRGEAYTGARNFAGPHWDEPNVLVHARFNERIDSEGRKVLFIEEIQSDWHQQGRERGYQEEIPEPEITVEPALEDSGYRAEGFWTVTIGGRTSQNWRANTADEARAMALEGWRKNTALSGVPDAPFRKTWHELMFRRVLRWAAENDFDVLAWTTGEQQAERYDLSKQINRINYWKDSETTYAITAHRDAAGGQSSDHTRLSAEKLAELVGKELAQKIIDTAAGPVTAEEEASKGLPVKTLSGLDLKIGGEGMRGFYDKILVDYAKKYGKQWGAKVGETAIVLGPEAITATGAGPWTAEGQELAQVHSLDITPSMRESVLQGQSLFQPDPDLSEIQKAIKEGMPVPDDVLEQFRDDPVVAVEIRMRNILVDHARRSATLQNFIDWMMRADSPHTEAYYELIWNKAHSTPEDPDISSDRFISALDDDTLTDLMAEIQVMESGDPESPTIKALTPEMIELGQAALKGPAPAELIQKVRSQIAEDPQRWRQVLKNDLPEQLQGGRDEIGSMRRDLNAELTNKEAEVNAPTDFHPISAQAANQRFRKMMEAEGGIEKFLGDLYHEEHLGARQKGKQGGKQLPVDMKVAASKAQRGVPFDPATRKAVLREIRNDTPYWRAVFAGMYQDQEMMMQLQWEVEHADEAEDIRLRKENARLRDQLKKLRQASALKTNLDKRKLAELEALVKEKDAEIQQAALRVAKARAEVEAVEAKLTEKQKAKAQAELGRVPDEDEPPIVKAYYRRIERLEQQIAFMRQAEQQAMIAKANAERAVKLGLYIQKPVDAGIAAYEGRAIEEIQARVAYDPEDVDQGMLSRIREWRRRNPDAQLPSDLVQQIERRRPRDMTLEELEQVAIQIRDLRKAGRKKRSEQLAAERTFIEDQVGLILSTIGAEQKDKILGTRQARKERKTNAATRAYWGMLRMPRLTDMIEGGKKLAQLLPDATIKTLASQMGIPEATVREQGPMTVWLWTAVNQATDNMITNLRRIQTAHEAKLAELKIQPRQLGKVEHFDGHPVTHGEMIGVYIYQQFEDGLFSLITDNNISKPTITMMVNALSKEEKQYGDWLIDTLSTDQDFDRLLDAQVLFNNSWMERVERYFPFKRSALGGGPFITELISELLSTRGYARRPRIPGFLRPRMERREGVPYGALTLDAPAVFASHIQQREFFIAHAQLMKRLKRIFDNRETRAALTQRFGEAMPELVGNHLSAVFNDNLYRTHEDYGHFGRLARTMVSGSLIAWNFMTVARNLVDIPTIVVQAGAIDALGAAAQILRNPLQTSRFVTENSPQIADRSYDRFTEEMKQLPDNLYARVVRKVNDVGFLGLWATDWAANSIGWLAVYNREMRKTGNHEYAKRAAEDFILRHRPAARAKDLPRFYKDSGLYSWLLMFSNQLNQQWNIMSYDIPVSLYRGIVKGQKGEIMKAARESTAFVVAAVAMAMIEKKRAPEPEELPKDILAWIFGNVPFIGRALEAQIRGDRLSGPLSPFQGFEEAPGRVKRIIDPTSETMRAREAINLIFDAMRATGLPAVQGRRFYKTIETGDPWELFGGPPKAAGE